MESVALIVEALAAGGGAAARSAASDAMTGAYGQLWQAVFERLAGHPDGELALARYKADPRAGQMPLAAALAQARAGNDAGLVASALTVLELAGGAGKYKVPVSRARGVQVGDNNTQVSYFIGQDRGQRGTGVLAGAAPTGRPLAEVTDPFALEVHRPVAPDSPRANLPGLPSYVARGHDAELAHRALQAVNGHSGIAVLVAGSSVGKTRACWEVLRLLRDQEPQWRLWHPIDPSPREAALRDLAEVGPRTVIWLNEAQLYLYDDTGQGERVAAGIRELLRDPDRAPVLVLATLWPSYWNELTARLAAGPDAHAQARALLAGHDIPVPAAFTEHELGRLRAAGDERLDAAARAEGRQVTQFLAGAPELLSRYHSAPAGAKALITAAMDARRLGIREALPLAFLAAAAPGYLTGTEPDDLSGDWLEQALAYAAMPCGGVRGPLTRSGPSNAAPDGKAAYRLADYLDQYGRRSRRGDFPPPAFWAAAAGLADPGDLNALAAAASRRGLLYQAAGLRKLAAAAGNDFAAAGLIRALSVLHPGDHAPARWVAERAALDNPEAAALLLDALQGAGAAETAAELADRAAATLPAGRPAGRGGLLGPVTDVDDEQRMSAIADRAQEYRRSAYPMSGADAIREVFLEVHAFVFADQNPVSLGSDYDRLMVTTTLHALQVAADGQRAGALADRVTARSFPGKRSAAGFLLGVLRRAALEGKDSEPAAFDDSDTYLVVSLKEDSSQQAFILLDTDNDAQFPAALGSVFNRLFARAMVLAESPTPGVTRLLQLPGGGRVEQSTRTRHVNDATASRFRAEVYRDAHVIELLERAAAFAALDEPADLAFVLDALRQAGADRQVADLLDRAPAAHVSLDDAYGVARLLDALREAGADRQVADLLDRAPAAHIGLHHADGATRLLNALREAGAGQQAAALTRRLPAEGLFSLFLEHGNHQARYRFGREPDGNPAPEWGWNDLNLAPLARRRVPLLMRCGISSRATHSCTCPARPVGAPGLDPRRGSGDSEGTGTQPGATASPGGRPWR